MSILDKISKIEALIERAGSEGERIAALLAKERILAKMAQDREHLPIEYKFSFESSWQKRLFSAVCNKHGFKPYRYARQRYTTSHLKVSKAIVDGVLWPEHVKWNTLLNELIEELMQDIIGKIHKSDLEETVVQGELSQ